MEDILPTASERVTELVARLQARFGRKDGEKDGEEAEALRYVIYVRKSTGENAGKQERAIGEQTAECKGLAERLGLRWVEVIHEEQSAMTSDGRPKFRAMLNELKEDGEITDMLAPVRAERNTTVGVLAARQVLFYPLYITMRNKKTTLHEGELFLVTYCTENWNTLIIDLKRWSTVLEAIPA